MAWGLLILQRHLHDPVWVVQVHAAGMGPVLVRSGQGAAGWPELCALYWSMVLKSAPPFIRLLGAATISALT